MSKNLVSLTVDGSSYTARPYGTCTTEAATAAKVVTCADFVLATNATVLVYFKYANNASSPTLNVNGTGAKNIFYRDAALTSSLYYWGAGDTVEFVYDGTQWKLLNVSNSNDNTKNTAGAANSSSKLYLVGATTQGASPTTYSHDTAYIGTDGCLYSGSKKVSIEHDHPYLSSSTKYAGSSSVGGIATKAHQDANGNIIADHYLSKWGGTMNGPLKFTSESLPSKELKFVCGIDGFDDGGEMGWSSTTDLAVGLATKDGSGNTITSTYATKSELNSAKSSLQSSIDGKSYLNPAYSVSSNDDKTHYYKLFTLTPRSKGYGDFHYVFEIAERSSQLTTVHIYANTANNEKYFNVGHICYDGEMGTKLNAYYFKDTTNKVERIEIWGTVIAWNTWKIIPKTDNKDTYIGIEWNGTEGSTLPANATSTLAISPKDLSGNAATATKATQDGSGNTITSTYATKSELAGKSDSHSHPYLSNSTKYAASSSAGGAATSANKVNSSLTVKLNSGTTEGTNMFTFNGSAAKTVNVTPSSIGAAAASHSHDAYVNPTVTPKNPTLAWSTTSTIATIGGTELKVTMPANPDTNTTYAAGSGLTLYNNQFSLTATGVSSATYGTLGRYPQISVGRDGRITSAKDINIPVTRSASNNLSVGRMLLILDFGKTIGLNFKCDGDMYFMGFFRGEQESSDRESGLISGGTASILIHTTSATYYTTYVGHPISVKNEISAASSIYGTLRVEVGPAGTPNSVYLCGLGGTVVDAKGDPYLCYTESAYEVVINNYELLQIR